MRKKNERFVRVRNRTTIFFSFVRYVYSLSLVPPFGDILLLVPPSQPSHTRCSHVSEKLGPPPFTHTIVRYGSFISLDFPPTSSRCTRLSSTWGQRLCESASYASAFCKCLHVVFSENGIFCDDIRDTLPIQDSRSFFGGEILIGDWWKYIILKFYWLLIFRSIWKMKIFEIFSNRK